MSYSAIAQSVPVVLFTGIVLLAAEQDLRERSIANRPNHLLALLAPTHCLAGTAFAAAGAVAAGVLVLIVGTAMFAHG